MSKIKNITERGLSFLLGGVILLTSSGFIASAIKKDAEMNSQKETIIETTIRNEEKFSEQYESYDEYIELIKHEIIATNMHRSAMDVFETYQLLQDNGLLSLGDDFEFGTADYELTGNLGISVITGKSVCRNQAYNLYRVFKALGYDTTVSFGELYSSTFIKGNSNHAVTCVKEDGIYYLFDPTNNTIYLRNALGQFKSIDNEENKFYPSPYSDEIFSNLSDNAGLHVYMGDDFGSKVTFKTRRETSKNKAAKNIDFYINFEDDFLKEIEEEIDTDFREYFNLDEPTEGLHDGPIKIR